MLNEAIPPRPILVGHDERQRFDAFIADAETIYADNDHAPNFILRFAADLAGVLAHAYAFVGLRYNMARPRASANWRGTGETRPSLVRAS
jgi:hypothetical protein